MLKAKRQHTDVTESALSKTKQQAEFAALQAKLRREAKEAQLKANAERLVIKERLSSVDVRKKTKDGSESELSASAAATSMEASVESIDVTELTRAELFGEIDESAGKRLDDHVESRLKKSKSTKNTVVAETKDSLEIARTLTQQMLSEIGIAAEKQPAVITQILEILGTELGHAREGQGARLNLPEQAPELYKDRLRDPATGRLESIPTFLERVWKPWIETSVLTRPDFRRLDPEGEMALRNWLRNPENQLPDHLHIPTKGEAIDKKLETANTDDLREAWRIASAVQRRQKQANAK